VLQCKPGGAGDCLDAAEIKALRAIYQGPRTRDARQISAGSAVGGEAVEWDNWFTGAKPAHRGFAEEFFRWMVYADPSWTLDRFNLDRDYAVAQTRMGPIVNSDDPDIRPFLKHGGKLMLYHGWADAALPPGNTITYYEGVRRKAPAAANQVRLFMVPGMAHCGNGPGPSQVDWLAALDDWAESGKAPERIIASKPENFMNAFLGLPWKSVRTRPLCAWPKQARWNGEGSTDEVANFRCVAEK
jgi:feruloyl esterase